jgi:hypothetical protein
MLGIFESFHSGKANGLEASDCITNTGGIVNISLAQGIKHLPFIFTEKD